METLLLIAAAIAGMIWAFFRGKDTQKRDDLEGEVERERERIDRETGETQDKVDEVEEKIDEIDDRIDEVETGDMSAEEAAEILRRRFAANNPPT